MRTRQRPRYTRAGEGRATQPSRVELPREARLELWGLGFFTLGLLVFLSGIPEAGFIPGFLRSALRFLVGSLGAGVVSLSLMAIGVMTMLRLAHLRLRHAIIGLAMVFVVLLGLQQMSSPQHGLTGRDFTEEAGGLLGVVIAEGFRGLFGRILGTIVLLIAGLAGVMVLTGLSLASALRLAGRAGHSAAASSWRRLHLTRDRESRRRRLQRIAARSEARQAPAATDEPLPETISLPELPAPEPEPVEEEAAPLPIAAEAAEEVEPAALPSETEPEPTQQEPVQLSFADRLPMPREPQYPNYELPPLSLLSETPVTQQSREDNVDKMELLERTLASFGIEAKVVEIERGPRVTRYEIQPPPGVRVSRITNLADDLALALAALDVRVEAPVPGKGVIGIEVPNSEVVFVDLKQILDTPEFQNHPSLLAFALGKDISGHPRTADLAKMPHLLVAGATNSGKSVCLNAMIVSILFRARPDEVKFLMVDPKRVELSLFADIPHLVAPVAHDAKEAAGLLRWAIREMEHRYEKFADLGVRNIYGFNEQAAIDQDLEPMPFLVIVVDELADLMMQAAAEFEASICRIAQLARATGIHLVVATQRPSVNVITGTIKANIASRIAFAVASQVDSRTILDMNGAERLVGSGDMLFMPFDASKPTRIQGAYLREADINRVVRFLRDQASPQFCAQPVAAEKGGLGDDEVDDELFDRALEYVLSTNYASTSMLQRKMRIGYTRAARLMDLMESRGYVGPADGSKPREILAARIYEDRGGTPDT